MNRATRIEELMADFAAGRNRPSTWLQNCLAAARRDDAEGHVYTRILHARAPTQAAVADARWAAGVDVCRWPLLGIPVTVKDNIDLQGTETSCGCRPAGPTAGADAAIVRLLESRGAVILGKTNLDECAFGASGRNERFGRCINPHDARLSSGGSSSGAAASVAAGHALLAVGTDTLGSVRIPAAFCGLAGYKPSHGRLDLAGVAPLHTGFDTLGLLARSMQDLAQAAAVLLPGPAMSGAAPAGAVPSGAASPPARLWVLDESALADADPQIAQDYRRCIEILRRRGEFACRTLPPWDLKGLARAALWEVAHSFAALCRAGGPGRPALDTLGADLRHLLDLALSLPHARLMAGRALLEQSGGRLGGWLGAGEALLTPTCPVAAPSADAPTPRNIAAFVTPANVAGLPALCWPQSLAGSRSVSLQLIGRSGRDSDLFDLCAVVQRLLDGDSGGDAGA